MKGGDSRLFTSGGGLKPGRYRLEPLPPNDGWYVKSIRLSGAPVAGGEIGRDGAPLKPGERLMNVQVTLATGASGLGGRLATQQAKTSGRSRVHLIPSEPEAQNNTLRFAEVPAGGDGSFSFGNLAPGKYWLLVRPVSGSQPNDGAAATNALIELKPCQRMTDYALP
ncbi:MAG TPA: hypothetical protein VJ302_32530 [Blastocatellia bacterium]|nr:hypothetical protein [Blastocatellia bacterium]